MAINFPSSPIQGQVYEFGDYVYTFDGVKWTSVAKYGLAAAKISSETPPPSPEAGLMWYVPSTGESYLWYDDGDSGQWIQENPSIGSVAHRFLEGVNEENSHKASAISLEEGGNVQGKLEELTGLTSSYLIAQGLSGDYGFFADGFAYVNIGDVGVDVDGGIWKYTGSGAPSKVVAAGVTPSVGSGYELVVFNSDANILTVSGKSIRQEGIGVWDTNTTYPVNGLVKGSNGQVYTAISEQSGNNPVSDSGTNWTLFGNGLKVISSGTTPRDMSERFSQTVNVKDFGAVGDGILDDGQFFRDAILSLSLTGGVVEIPVGIFKIETPFYVPAWVTLRGSGDKTVLKGYNPSGIYTASASALSRVENLALDGENSEGWGLQVDNRAIISNVRIYRYRGTTDTEDGTGILLEGAYASVLYDVRVTNCRQGGVIGRLGTTKENNTNMLYNCSFEYTENAGLLVNKANLLTLNGCNFGHHGGYDGSEADGIAISIQNLDASVIMDGVYTEWCVLGVVNEGKTLDIRNGRFSSQIRVNSGQVSVSFCEFYGYGGFVDCPNGSTGYALVTNNHAHTNSPLVGPENFENRVTVITNSAGSYLIKNGLTVYGGGNVRVRDNGNLTVEGGVIRSTATSGAAIGSFNGGSIGVGGADFENTDANFGVVLKAPNAQRYRIKVDNTGTLTTTLLT